MIALRTSSSVDLRAGPAAYSKQFADTIFNWRRLVGVRGRRADCDTRPLSPFSLLPANHSQTASLICTAGEHLPTSELRLTIPLKLASRPFEVFTASMAGSTSPAANDQKLQDATQKSILKTKVTDPRNFAKDELKQKVTESTVLRLNNEFAVLTCQDGDTLLYIGPPPQTLSESQTWDHAYIQNHFNLPHRVHSSKFLCLNSKKFNDLFGPRSIRTERRFRKEGIMSRVSTEGIKFFVDLRPPTEDEEAVVLLTSLTCTKGVLAWHTAQDKYGLSSLLVAGHDDSSSIPVDFHLPVTLPKDKEASSDQNLSHPKKLFDAVDQPSDKEQFDSLEALCTDDLIDLEKGDKDVEPLNTTASSLELPAKPLNASELASPSPNLAKTSSQKPAAATSSSKYPDVILPEYSPLRHRSAIERLVQAIENGDPKLDSAPKFWTFFAVAKYFDCASHEKISRWITKWLLNYPNSNFIQSNPEVALRIGLGTQSEDATKDAFSMLVGEKSLLNVFGESYPSVLSPLVQSVHGRKLELLDDDERNRIDHAAASLVRRMRQKFDELVGNEMAWLQRSSYFRKTFSEVPRTQEEADVIKKLIQKVKQYVRGRIIWVLCRTYDDDFVDFEQALNQVRAFYPGTRNTFRESYNMLNEKERIFTRFFWTALSQERLADGAVNLWTGHISKLGLPKAESSSLSQKMLDTSMPSGERWCQVVSKKELVALFTQFNQIRRSHMAINGQAQKQPLFQSLRSWEAETVSPTNHEVHEQLEQPAKTPERSTGAWAYNSFNGFKSLYATSPKRDQHTIPSTQLTEKRRKLSDADVNTGIVPAAPSAFESLSIRLSGTSFNERDVELFDQVNNTSQDPNPEIPTLRNTGVNSKGGQENAGEFGNDNFLAQHFRPILPNLQSRGLSMKDATFCPRIADMSWNPDLSPKPNKTQAPVMMSDDHTMDAAKGSQDRVITAEDYSYDTDDDKPGSMTTAADWSLQADDVDRTRPKVMQQFSDHPPKQQGHSEPDQLLYVELLYDVGQVLHRICDEILNPAHLFHGDNLLPTNLIDTLMCLNDDEWKYLPLWAGGNDDGSGGVFDEVDVPNLEAGGFKGGKRGMGSVSDSSTSSSVSGSSFDDIGSDAISTVGKASKAATDGTQTVKSSSDIGSEDEGFTRQDELWDEIRNMKVDSIEAVGNGNGNGADKGKARAEEYEDDIDDEDVGDVDTILGAGSTDGADDMMGDDEDPETANADFGDDSDEDDMDIINSDDL